MVRQALVIGDVHGMIHHLEQLLQQWSRGNEQLIFVGDYIDRGIDSRQTLLLVHELTILKGAIALRGNHEEMLIDFLHNPRDYWTQYYLNSGNTTVADLLDMKVEEVSSESGELYQREILSTYPWLLPWLEQLPYYTEFGEFIIVHAGVDLEIEDWRDSGSDIFTWTRDEFLTAQNNTGKQIIFGHTPTITMQPEGGLYQSADGKLGIDGGAVYNLALIGLRITPDAISEVISITI
ncbi:serine/threonine protein phosphatase [Aerococcaceae bacterium DSM 111176]|nr:serine/threonine protein phosphatase [Aerococcaceae bacterium DSM 111176]